MRLWVLGLLLLQAATNASAGLMYGIVGFPDTVSLLATLDTAAPGTLTVIGSTGVPDSPYPLTGLDFAPNGSLYASAFDGSIYGVNPATGLATLIGNSGFSTAGNYAATDLSWDPIGNRMLLLGASDIIGSAPVLYEVNLTTGAVSLLGAITGIAVPAGEVGLAVDSAGAYYVHSLAADAFYRVNRNTLAATTLAYLGFDGNYQQGAAVDRSSGDILYWASTSGTDPFAGRLYTVDRTTGTPTLLGTMGVNHHATGVELMDIAFAPSSVPEPGTWALAGVGLAAVWLVRRRASVRLRSRVGMARG